MSLVSGTAVHLAIPSELAAVRFAGAALRGVLGEAGWEPDQVSSIELCMVEAINNAIEHAYQERSGHQVWVTLELTVGALELTVVDRGVAMPPEILERTRASLAAREEESDGAMSELAEGGYGLSLILQLMEAVSYRSERGENRLAMVLHRATSPVTEAATEAVTGGSNEVVAAT